MDLDDAIVSQETVKVRARAADMGVPISDAAIAFAVLTELDGDDPRSHAQRSLNGANFGLYEDIRKRTWGAITTWRARSQFLLELWAELYIRQQEERNGG